MTAPLGRDAILAAPDIVTERVEVPEWGGAVLVRSITAKERDDFEKSLIVGKGRKADVSLDNIRAKLAALTIVDAAGVRIFAETDVAVLGAKSARALQRVFEVAMTLSGLTGKDLDELLGESGGEPSATSPSGSPATLAGSTST